MGKQYLNKLISNLKKADWTTKISPWMNEQGFEVRYVGLRPKDWNEILSDENNLLLKLSIQGPKGDFAEILFANKPPFVSLHRQFLTKETKWEHVLGAVRYKLGKDKEEYQQKKAKIDNLYQKILSQLKK